MAPIVAATPMRGRDVDRRPPPGAATSGGRGAGGPSGGASRPRADRGRRASAAPAPRSARRPRLRDAPPRAPAPAPRRAVPSRPARPAIVVARRPRARRRHRARPSSSSAGSDVTGRVQLRQGGSAATTARWLGRLGARSTLICAVGRDAPGRALVAALAGDGVTVRAVRVAGERTGRIGVVVEPAAASARSSRSAAPPSAPAGGPPARPGSSGADALHLPAYSLLDQPLGDAGLAAITLARAAGARVCVDLASAAPLLARGREAALELLAARRAGPRVRDRATRPGRSSSARASATSSSSPRSAVVKRGREGATILVRDGGDRLRFEVATTPIAPPTRPAPATRSTPGSSPAGSTPGERGSRARRPPSSAARGAAATGRPCRPPVGAAGESPRLSWRGPTYPQRA